MCNNSVAREPTLRAEKNKAIRSDTLVGFERRSTCSIFSDRFCIPPSFDSIAVVSNYSRNGPTISSSLLSIPLELLPTDLHCFIHGLRGHLYASFFFFLSLSLSLGRVLQLTAGTNATRSSLAGAKLRKHRCARHIKSICRTVKARQRTEPFRKSPKIMNCRLPYLPSLPLSKLPRSFEWCNNKRQRNSLSSWRIIAFVNSVSVTLLYISRCCYYFESRIFLDRRK